jgi:hypothetical protein
MTSEDPILGKYGLWPLQLFELTRAQGVEILLLLLLLLLFGLSH